MRLLVLGSVALICALGCGTSNSVKRSPGDGGGGGNGGETASGGKAGSAPIIDVGDSGSGGEQNEPTGICGNGEREPDELCDDGNTGDGDGCSGDCLEQDPDYDCSAVGEPCQNLVV